MEPSRRIVDVYYHCSILQEYPIGINSTIKDEVQNYKNLGRITLDQLVYMRSKTKNSVNIQFEQIIKESSIDCNLNYNGNISRLEQFVFPGKEFSELDKNKNIILYDRTKNKYYLNNYGDSTDRLKEIELDSMFNLKDKSYVTFPPVNISIKQYKNADAYIEKKIDRYISSYDYNNKIMVSAVNFENIESFNASFEGRMNFLELKEYAIKKGEDIYAWNYFDDMRKKTELSTILIDSYMLHKKDGNREQFVKYFKNYLEKSLDRRKFKDEDSYENEKKYKDKLKKILISTNKGNMEVLQNFCTANNINKDIVDQLNYLQLQIITDIIKSNDSVITPNFINNAFKPIEDGGEGGNAIEYLKDYAVSRELLKN